MGEGPDGCKPALVPVVSQGTVRVTVVGVAAHWVQTVTVVVQPSGSDGVVCGEAPDGPDGAFVIVGVAETVSGQYVVV